MNFKTLQPGACVSEFTVQKFLGKGSFGHIYQVLERSSHRRFAMKVEPFDKKHKTLTDEIDFFTELKGSPFFPIFHCQGETDQFRYFVMELHGPSLEVIRNAMKAKRLSKFTLYYVAYHSLCAIEELHHRGLIHRDIKPENMVITTDPDHPIALIDFGLCRRYRSKDGEHLPPRRHPGFTGTVLYSSLNAHDKMELSRRDDLISWFYSVLELGRGYLQWPGGENRARANRMKREAALHNLCLGFPEEFLKIWNLINRLHYEDDPDYEELKWLVKLPLSRLKSKDTQLDWQKMDKEKLAELTSLSSQLQEAYNAQSTAKELEMVHANCTCNIA